MDLGLHVKAEGFSMLPTIEPALGREQGEGASCSPPTQKHRENAASVIGKGVRIIES